MFRQSPAPRTDGKEKAALARQAAAPDMATALLEEERPTQGLRTHPQARIGTPGPRVIARPEGPPRMATERWELVAGAGLAPATSWL